MDQEILTFFLEEAHELLQDLKTLGQSLKRVGIPNEEESQKLNDFAQKLNRLIGGAASTGFSQFSPISRKTSLLAEKCSEIKEMPIRILILNLNMVINVLSDCFSDTESAKDVETKIPEIEKRIDMCMAAVNLDEPEVKSQNEIDDILAGFDL